MSYARVGVKFEEFLGYLVDYCCEMARNGDPSHCFVNTRY
jgi:hypothetical protein